MGHHPPPHFLQPNPIDKLYLMQVDDDDGNHAAEGVNPHKEIVYIIICGKYLFKTFFLVSGFLLPAMKRRNPLFSIVDTILL